MLIFSSIKEAAMDILSEVLQIVRLTGAIFFTARLSGPWSVSSPPPDELARGLQSRADCIALFHIVTEGSFWVKMENRPPLFLEKGNVIIFPHSHSHIMCNSWHMTPAPVLRLINFERIEGLPKLSYGTGEEKTRLICGYLKCNQQFNPLINALPEVLLLSPHHENIRKNVESNPDLSSNILPLLPGSWMDQSIAYLRKEMKDKEVGSTTIITRLTEMLFVEVLRKYMQQLPEKCPGWLAGIKDPEVGKALQLLHEQPGKKWSVSQLALDIGVSRSALAQRFNDIIGEPPMRYLTGWRMQLAQHLLARPEFNLAMVAEQVGYDSEIAFNRVFKRYTGTPPASWRNQVLVRAS